MWLPSLRWLMFRYFQQRRMLRERAIENAAQVEKAYGAILGIFVDIHSFQLSCTNSHPR